RQATSSTPLLYTTLFRSLLVQNQYVAERMFGLLTNLLVGLLAVALTTVAFLGWRPALLVTATLPLGAFMVLAGLNWMSIPLHQIDRKSTRLNSSHVKISY